jgi:hypothetical protein
VQEITVGGVKFGATETAFLGALDCFDKACDDFFNFIILKLPRSPHI